MATRRFSCVAQGLNRGLAPACFQALSSIQRTPFPEDPSRPNSSADPRQELIEQLLNYERIRRDAAEFLGHKLQESSATWSRPGAEETFSVGTGAAGSQS